MYDDASFRLPESRSFLEYWFELRDGEVVPPKARFKPASIRPLLPYMVIYEFCSEAELRLRLIGTAITTRRGRDETNMRIPVPKEPNRQGLFIRTLKDVIEHPCGFHSVVKEKYASGRFALVETINLPMVDKNGDARFVVCFSKECSNRSLRPAEGNGLTEISEQWREFIDIGAGTPVPLQQPARSA